MKKLSTYIFEHKWAYGFAILSMLISISLDMFSPQLTRQIVDDVIIGGQTNRLKYLLFGLCFIGVGRAIFHYTKEYTFDKTGATIIGEMRKNLFDHIQSLSAEFFDRTGTGELMSRIKDDLDRIWDGLTFVGMLIIEVVVHSSIVLFCMYSLSPKLAIIPTICMALAAFIAIYMERKLDGVYGAISEENATLNTVAEENLAGVRTVKAFAREKHEIAKFLSHNKQYYELNMQQSKLFVKYYPYINLITKILPLSVLLIGGSMAVKGEITLGTLSAFIEYSMNIVWPMEMLGWLTNSISSAVASNKKLKAIYAEKPVITEPQAPIRLDSVKGKVEFKNVTFHKADGHNILQDISFTVEPGKTIGIMGATGAGKTTIIQLLQRLYDVSEGQICLDGVDVKDLSLKQLRGSISSVTQDIFLFSDTISENIKLGKKHTMTSDAVKRATSDAQARGFVERMSNKYDTVIGERGVGLSGGQKQRITIARALAHKCPILVLDDSTSALDMETEQSIQQTLRELTDTTKIIIAHRISAVCHADEIIVLENGSIKERGTHKSLLEKKGLYHKTYTVQYGTYRKEDQVNEC